MCHREPAKLEAGNEDNDMRSSQGPRSMMGAKRIYVQEDQESPCSVTSVDLDHLSIRDSGVNKHKKRNIIGVQRYSPASKLARVKRTAQTATKATPPLWPGHCTVL